ncbi:Semaphorin-7A [Bagarius yarrelli]|uniref:Semaphorin-7A n=1 Tax=Bagarius yarrelli TaxID=175774 RepID=A0A556TQN3_BAGYA|nr:Semaphorin-7A [Bagarius yarrelli]
MIDNLKLIQDPHSMNIYAGGPQGLFMFNPQKHSALTVERNCESKISLLKEGRNGNPLFICGINRQNTECCDVSSAHQLVNCYSLKTPPKISEPSVHVGDSLYYTVSHRDKAQSHLSGLYRSAVDKYIWPLSRQLEQRYFKIIANQGSGLLDGKVYSFYIEQTQNQDPEMPLWIPRVSQICMADLGGSKAILQFRWTSMLTARLFCGDEKKRTTYSEFLDVAVLEAPDWENTTIYGLFKNAYNLSALCVYRMSDIIRVFESNSFKSSQEPLSSPRPGECVKNSLSLPSNILRFMESLPELKQWIKPVRNPLLFNPHHHYTHLQVDRLENRKSGHSHQVLFMSLDNGNVHKILEQDDEPFIITEYQPFKTRTHISSMLLDSVNKKLFVSSSSEVIQIDLYNCGVYGTHCDSCVMARDPYCGWDLLACSANNGSAVELHAVEVSECEFFVPITSESSSHGKRETLISVPQYSSFYLKCPMESQHASYAWYHQGRWRACVSSEQDCLALIDNMSDENEGVYQCIASENGYDRAVVLQQLQMNGASRTKATRVALAWLLCLIFVIC